MYNMSVKFFDRDWLVNQPEGARRSAGNLIVMLVIQLIVVITTLTTPPDHGSYYKVHGGLFVASILLILAFLAVKGTLTMMLRHTWRTFVRPGKVALPEVVDALRVVTFVVALTSLTFIVDLSFFKHGFRIGGATAVSLYLVFKALRERWRAVRP